MRKVRSNKTPQRSRLLRTTAPFRAAFLLLLLIITSCCLVEKETPPPQLPVHYVHQDGFDITWREQRDGEEILFYGVLRNDHAVYLENLSMTVSLLDEEGGVVDTRTFVGFPITFPRKAQIPFSLRFPYRSSRSGERAAIEFSYILANAVGPSYSVFQTICHLNDRTWEAGHRQK